MMKSIMKSIHIGSKSLQCADYLCFAGNTISAGNETETNSVNSFPARRGRLHISCVKTVMPYGS